MLYSKSWRAKVREKFYQKSAIQHCLRGDLNYVGPIIWEFNTAMEINSSFTRSFSEASTV
jgi:hypothetical protein